MQNYCAAITDKYYYDLSLQRKYRKSLMRKPELNIIHRNWNLIQAREKFTIPAEIFIEVPLDVEFGRPLLLEHLPRLPHDAVCLCPSPLYSNLLRRKNVDVFQTNLDTIEQARTLESLQLFLNPSAVFLH